MKLTLIKSGFVILIFLIAITSANASLVITVSENEMGGTNWAFSNGTGNVSGAGNTFGGAFLPGGTPQNPQPFYASDSQDFSLVVLQGNNTFNIDTIFVRNFGGISGTNGPIFDGIDFQVSGGTNISGLPIDGMNGLILYASEIAISSFNMGTYSLDSFFDGYNTDLGLITLNIGVQPIPIPGAIWLFGTAFFGLLSYKKRKIS